MSTLKRKLAVKSTTKSTATPEMKKLAKEFFIANEKKNKLAKEATTARELLFGAMTREKVTSFSFGCLNDQKEAVTLKAEIKTPVSNVIDVDQLKKELPEEIWNKILQASPPSLTAVKEFVGTAQLKAATIPKKGEPNVSVKKA